MAERRKNRKRKDDVPPPGDVSTPASDKPTKEEYAVAKWIRDNVPSKKTKFLGHNVEYFTGSRAVGALLENSPWNKTLFDSRESITDFLDTMLRHKFFHRAKKIVVTEEELNKMRGSKKKSNKESKEEKKSQEKEKEKDDGAKDAAKETGDAKDGKEKKDDEERKEPKKKPKVRLEMHTEQYFADCNDAYIWIYESIPIYYWFFGTLVVLGAIGLCLFPLWPWTIRQGVYYLSVAGAGLFVFILTLAIIRVIVFSLFWLITFGRHHLWLLPNLSEDVGFFGSFWPLYQYEYCGPGSNDDKKSSKKKRHKKDKDSDNEEGPPQQSSSATADKVEHDKRPKCEDTTKAEEPRTDTVESTAEEGSEEGSESEKSNTGKDFEMVQHNELDEK